MAADSQESELWALSKTETISTFEAWRQSITYTLSSEPLFAPFFNDNVIWDTKSRRKPTRGFTDDNYDVPDSNRLTAAQKAIHLNLLLGRIAMYAPVVARYIIVDRSTSISSVWKVLCLHYGFQATEYNNIVQSYECDEIPEALLQPSKAFKDSCLLNQAVVPSHYNKNEEVPTDDDSMYTDDDEKVAMDDDSMYTDGDEEVSMDDDPICTDGDEEVPTDDDPIYTDGDEEVPTDNDSICTDGDEEVPIYDDPIYTDGDEEVSTDNDSICTDGDEEVPTDDFIYTDGDEETPMDDDSMYTDGDEEVLMDDIICTDVDATEPKYSDVICADGDVIEPVDYAICKDNDAIEPVDDDTICKDNGTIEPVDDDAMYKYGDEEVPTDDDFIYTDGEEEVPMDDDSMYTDGDEEVLMDDDVIFTVNDTIEAVDDAAICPDGDEVEPIDDDATYTDCDELDREECDIRHIGNDELKLIGDDFAYNARLQCDVDNTVGTDNMKEAERWVTVNHVTITTQAGNTHQSYKCLAQPIVTDTGSTSRMNDEQHAQLNKQRHDNVQCVIPSEDITRGNVVKLVASVQHTSSENQIKVYTNTELSHAKSQYVSRIDLDQDVRVKLSEYFRNVVLCQDVVGVDCSKSPQLPAYLSSYSSSYSVQCLQGLQLTFFIQHKECLAGEVVSETTIEVLDSPFHVYNITVNVVDQDQESLYYLTHVLPDSARDLSRYHDPCSVPLAVIYVARKKIAALQVVDVLRKSADASSIRRSTWTTGSSVTEEQEIMHKSGSKGSVG